MKNSIDHRQMEQLSAYTDGMLPTEEAKLLQQEINSTPGLQKELAELQAVRELLRNAPSVQLPRSFTLRPEAVAPQSQLWSPKWFQQLRLATTAMTAVFIVLVGFNVWRQPASMPQARLAPVAEAPAVGMPQSQADAALDSATNLPPDGETPLQAMAGAPLATDVPAGMLAAVASGTEAPALTESPIAGEEVVANMQESTPDMLKVGAMPAISETPEQIIAEAIAGTPPAESGDSLAENPAPGTPLETSAIDAPPAEDINGYSRAIAQWGLVVLAGITALILAGLTLFAYRNSARL